MAHGIGNESRWIMTLSLNYSFEEIIIFKLNTRIKDENSSIDLWLYVQMGRLCKSGMLWRDGEDAVAWFTATTYLLFDLPIIAIQEDRKWWEGRILLRVSNC